MEDLYRAGSRERSRSVIYKAEAMKRRTTRRFVVTTRIDAPKDLYEFYAAAGRARTG
ncbi:transposase [Rubrobacter taiwanensis]|uniref:transposase n=1 Tax=Rubrobacter taiwanensis TaxID=185139 RepID=UPI001FB4EB66|nr:transposase [Rubrobacter taiwanensis]